MIRLEQVGRDFRVGEQTVQALNNISLQINAGEYVSIMGPSGSGKTTFLNIAGLLEEMTSGTYELDGNRYIESSDFWYPSGTNIPGSKTAFEYQLKGNRWTINGYVKEVELSPSTGKMVRTDSTHISEIWMRISD